MKAIVDKKTYEKSINEVIYQFPYKMWGLSFVGVFLFFIIKAALNQTAYPWQDSLIFSHIFFYGTLIAALFYMSRKVMLTRFFSDMYSMEDNQDSDALFLPCCYYVSPVKAHLGAIVIEEELIYFEARRSLRIARPFQASYQLNTTTEGQYRWQTGRTDFLMRMFWGKDNAFRLVSSNEKHTFIVPDIEGQQGILKEALQPILVAEGENND